MDKAVLPFIMLTCSKQWACWNIDLWNSKLWHLCLSTSVTAGS